MPKSSDEEPIATFHFGDRMHGMIQTEALAIVRSFFAILPVFLNRSSDAANITPAFSSCVTYFTTYFPATRSR